jgi:hypothetical protein
MKNSLAWTSAWAVTTGLALACLNLASCNESSSSGGSGSGGAGEGGAGGAAGGSAGQETGGTGGGVQPPTYPPSLRATGLYAGDGEDLAEGVQAFTPRFELYSDGAEKRRWVYLPPGTQIDTSDPDYWDFPVGAKLWKEFRRDGVRVETRYLEKRSNGGFWRIAYQWNEEQTDAFPVPDGVENASGTPHDIPSRDACRDCHGRTDGEVLGFSAIQLGYDAPESLDLGELVSAGLLTDELTTELVLPGSEADRQALGYLHVNCGTCHNPTSSVQARASLDLRLRLGTLGSLEETPVATTAFGVDISVSDGTEPGGATQLIVPGDAEASAVFLRMNSRGELYSMPPLGTEIIDDDGVGMLRDWIDNLPQ